DLQDAYRGGADRKLAEDPVRQDHEAPPDRHEHRRRAQAPLTSAFVDRTNQSRLGRSTGLPVLARTSMRRHTSAAPSFALKDAPIRRALSANCDSGSRSWRKAVRKDASLASATSQERAACERTAILAFRA